MRGLFSFLLIAAVAILLFKVVTRRATVLSDDNFVAVRTLSQRVLQPLESASSISMEDARKALGELRKEAEMDPAHPNYGRVRQALRLIELALEEKNQYLVRAQSGSARNSLDAVPGEWHLVGHRDKIVDRAKLSQGQRSAFWTVGALKQWRARCDQYRVAIETSLRPTAARSSQAR